MNHQEYSFYTFTARDSELVAEMTGYFPWMLALSEDDRVSCAREVIADARASFSLGQPNLIVGTLKLGGIRQRLLLLVIQLASMSWMKMLYRWKAQIR